MRPEAARARALRKILSASTWLPQQFQLFQPMGGVRAMVSSTTILNSFSAEPRAFLARRVRRSSPGAGSDPVSSPVWESRWRPEGKAPPEVRGVCGGGVKGWMENCMGRSPVAGMRESKGEPGRTPKTAGPLMRGAAGGLGVRISGGELVWARAGAAKRQRVRRLAAMRSGRLTQGLFNWLILCLISISACGYGGEEH